MVPAVSRRSCSFNQSGIFDLIQPSFGLGLFTGAVPAAGLGALPDAPAAITRTVILFSSRRLC
jgi:hypothetical protein